MADDQVASVLVVMRSRVAHLCARSSCASRVLPSFSRCCEVLGFARLSSPSSLLSIQRLPSQQTRQSVTNQIICAAITASLCLIDHCVERVMDVGTQSE